MPGSAVPNCGILGSATLSPVAGIVAFSLAFAIVLYFAVRAWRQTPEEWLHFIERRTPERMRRWWPYSWIWKGLERYPALHLWNERIILSIGVVFTAIGLLVVVGELLSGGS